MIHINLEKIEKCPLCNLKGNFWVEASDRLHNTSNDVFAYSQCTGCETLYQSTRPEQQEVWKCYPENYGPHLESRPQQATWFRITYYLNKILNVLAEYISGTFHLKKKLNEVNELLRQSNAMLDFGCGSGKYLEHAKRLGCVGIGMDFSDRALAEVREKGFDAVSVSENSWSELERRNIDFVRMNHVIEHLYAPQDILSKIFKILHPGGILHLSTPNPLGYSSQNFKSAWFGLDCPRHIMLIPKPQMKSLLEKIGFSNIVIFDDPHPKDLVRSLAYRKIDRSQLPKETNVTSLATDGCLNLYWSIKMRWFLARGAEADRYHIIAYKE